jgi:hypothetical protein
MPACALAAPRPATANRVNIRTGGLRLMASKTRPWTSARGPKKTRTAAVVRMAVMVIGGSSALGARLRPPWGELTGSVALRMLQGRRRAAAPGADRRHTEASAPHAPSFVACSELAHRGRPRPDHKLGSTWTRSARCPSTLRSPASPRVPATCGGGRHCWCCWVCSPPPWRPV